MKTIKELHPFAFVWMVVGLFAFGFALACDERQTSESKQHAAYVRGIRDGLRIAIDKTDTRDVVTQIESGWTNYVNQRQ